MDQATENNNSEKLEALKVVDGKSPENFMKFLGWKISTIAFLKNANLWRYVEKSDGDGDNSDKTDEERGASGDSNGYFEATTATSAAGGGASQGRRTASAPKTPPRGAINNNNRETEEDEAVDGEEDEETATPVTSFQQVTSKRKLKAMRKQEAAITKLQETVKKLEASTKSQVEAARKQRRVEEQAAKRRQAEFDKRRVSNLLIAAIDPLLRVSLIYALGGDNSNVCPSELWERIVEHFESQGQITVETLRLEFHNIQRRRDEDIRDFGTRIHVILQQLQSLRSPISEEEAKSVFCQKVSAFQPEIRTAVSSLLPTQEYGTMKLIQVVARLSQVEMFHKRVTDIEEGTESKNGDLANFSRTFQNSGSNSSNHYGGGAAGAGTGGERGYGRFDPAKSERGYKSNFMGRGGRGRGGGGGGGRGRRPFGCFICDSPDHRVATCPHNTYRKGGGGSGNNNFDIGGCSYMVRERRQEEEEVREDRANATKAQDEKEHAFILDGGATVSQTGSAALLTNVTPAKRTVQVASGERLETIAKGDIGVIRDISYTPGIHCPLLSERQLIREGYMIIKKDLERAEIRCRETCKLKGTAYADPVTNLWMIDPRTIEPIDEEVRKKMEKKVVDRAHSATSVLKDSAIQAHLQTCLPISTLKELVDSGAVTGLNVRRKDLERDRELCPCCVKSNMTQNRTARTTKESVHRPGHAIQFDLYCNFRTSGINGERYIAVIVDKGGGVNGVYPLKTKDESLVALQKFVALKASIGERVRLVEMDGARAELNNQRAQDWMTREGIHYVVGAPRKHEHQAVVETHIRHLLDTARAMIRHAGLRNHPQFQFFAVQYANHVRNRTRLVEKEGIKKTRFEWSFNEKPDISKLHMWGVRGYARIPQEDRTFAGKTSSDKAFECIFLGYNENSKAYVVWDIEVKKLRHVGDFIADHVKTYRGTVAQERGSEDKIAIKDEEGDDEEEEEGNDEEESQGSPAEVFEGEEDEVEEEERAQQQEEKKKRGRKATKKTSRGKPTASSSTGAATGAAAKIKDKEVDVKSPPKPELRRSSRSRRAPANKDMLRFDDFEDEDMGLKASEIQEECELSVSDNMEKWVNESIDYVNATRPVEEKVQVLLQGEDQQRWREAMETELKAHQVNGTFEECDLPPGKRAYKHKWVMALKVNGRGEVERFKSRLTVAGWNMVHGVDYKESFAPTLKLTSLRVLLSMAMKEKMAVHQMDFETAYLNADLEEEVYMTIPDGYKLQQDGPRRVLRLRKSLYGLKQAGRNWNIEVNLFLQSLGFTQTSADPCIYLLARGGERMLLGVYVDDLAMACTSTALLQEIKSRIAAKYRVKDLGPLNDILGMHVEHKANYLEMSMEGYVKKILETFRMEDSREERTPMSTVEVPLEDLPRPRTIERPYRQLVGSLLYAAVTIFPETSYAVSRLSQHLEDYSERDWEAALRVVRYLKRNRTRKLTFGNCVGSSDEAGLIGFVDSDWGGDVRTRRSRYGYLFYLNNDLVSWKSSLEPTVALSSAEAELIAATMATKEAIWLKKLLGELGVNVQGPVEIFEDNKSCIALSKNPEQHQRTKHIDIKYFFVREMVARGLVTLEYVPSEDNLADILTKPLAPARFEALMENL